MIFSSTKIKSKSILVRFYNYSDSERGYGDAGTAAYFKIKLSSFIEVENSRSSSGKFYTYRLTEEADRKIKNLLGDFWGYGIGYDKGNEADRKKEADRLRKTLEVIETVQSI
jgi:hypothetical protein